MLEIHLIFFFAKKYRPFEVLSISSKGTSARITYQVSNFFFSFQSVWFSANYLTRDFRANETYDLDDSDDFRLFCNIVQTTAQSFEDYLFQHQVKAKIS